VDGCDSFGRGSFEVNGIGKLSLTPTLFSKKLQFFNFFALLPDDGFNEIFIGFWSEPLTETELELPILGDELKK
jgi:hypothetical protein